MSSAAQALLLALLAPDPAADATRGAGPDPARPRTEAEAEAEAGDEARAVFIAAEGLDAAALELEIAMRVPELHIAPLDATPSTSSEYIYIQARHESGRLHRIALIFSDGRAYYERIDVGEAGSPERVLASSIASLLVSIDAGAVEPDAVGVSAPVELAPAQPDTAPAPREAPPPSEPEPDAPEPSTAAPADDSPQPRLELGLRLGLHQLSAAGGPVFADRHLGWYGGVGVELRSARGLFAALELQPGGARAGDYRLTRLPIGAQLGYAWRGARLELVVAAGVSLTPWLVTANGQAEPVTRLDSGREGRPPLLSFGVRVSPGYLVPLERSGPLTALRVGPRLGLGGGFVLGDPPRVAGLVSPRADDLFRLGGIELDLGLELTLWFRAV